MDVKLDEDLPRLAVALIADKGHSVVNVSDQDMGGWKDDPLWEVVKREQRFFITADKGFADIRQFAPGTHAGILLLRPDQDGIQPILELLDRVLRDYELQSLSGTVSVATPRGIRIRRPSS
jgi:hypothetical protein